MRVDGRQPEDNTEARTYGVLVTRLGGALGTARTALAPHGTHLPDGTLTAIDALLDELARRRIRIAIYGEVKAGKSTLLNAIAGTTLSPVAFEPLTSIPVRVTHGPATAWQAGERQLASVADLEHLMRDGTAGVPEVVVHTDLDLLQLGGQVDLVDTPGVGADTQLDAVTAETLGTLDAVVAVVRYPGLFTQFTRRLVESLDADIGKLFVVWNLDTACAELSAAERARHAEHLRAQVAGAHELFLVDARRALQRAGDDTGIEALTGALRRFVSSDGRELTAVREAAKRAHAPLAGAQRALDARRAALDAALAATRRQLDEVQAEAIRAETAVRARHAECEAAVARIGQEGAVAAAQVAGTLLRQVRAARRQWVRRGDLAALDAALAEAVAAYAGAAGAAAAGTAAALREEAGRFGSPVADTPQEPLVLPAEPWTSDERRDRAVTGRFARLRRSLFRRWYLPGVTALERETVPGILRSQAAWRDAAVAAALAAIQQTLATELDRIGQRATAAAQRVKEETNAAANEAELKEVQQHLPIAGDAVTAVAGIAAEARRGFGTR